MKIGNLELNGVAALAPMAGATDRSFREIFYDFGAAYCVTEMVSTRALQYNYKKTQDLITLGEKEHPIAIQLFGDDPLFFASAANVRWLRIRMRSTSTWVVRCRKSPETTAAVR